MNATMASLNQQYGANALSLFEDNSNDYVVLVPGAFPYAAFDAVLSKVNY